MNGILGSYHTNCHDISLQLMRQFLSSDYYSFHSWPTEYRDQFSPLLYRHKYRKGSLLSSSLEQCLAHPEHVKPLPPVYVVAWELNQKQSVSTVLAPVIGHSNYTLFNFVSKSCSLISWSVGGFILGSTNSPIQRGSLSYARYAVH